MKLACNNITVDFSGLRALDKVSLSVETNEILGLIGPNGSGKTTLLNIIGLLDSFNSGEYFFNDYEVNKLNIRLKNKFRNVKLIKPKASRSASSELYMICTGFK